MVPSEILMADGNFKIYRIASDMLEEI